MEGEECADDMIFRFSIGLIRVGVNLNDTNSVSLQQSIAAAKRTKGKEGEGSQREMQLQIKMKLCFRRILIRLFEKCKRQVKRLS